MQISKTFKSLAVLACAALAACGGGGGGGGDDGGGGGGGNNPPPVASDCSALVSGAYTLFNPYEGAEVRRVSRLTIDTANNRATSAFENDTVARSPITYSVDGGCSYTIDEGDYLDKVMVSSSSVLVIHAQAKSGTTTPQRFAAFALPEQTQRPADWVGTWQLAVWVPVGTSVTGAPQFAAQVGEITFDASGTATSFLQCAPTAATCTATNVTARVRTRSDTTRYLDFIDSTTASIGKATLYKNAAGNSVFVVTTGDQRLFIGTPKRALGTLPAVNSTLNQREFTLEGLGAISALRDETVTVTAVDTATRNVTQSVTPGRVEVVRWDFPRDGVRYRAPNACGATPCAEFVGIPLQGMGISLSLGTSTTATNAFFSVAVTKP